METPPLGTVVGAFGSLLGCLLAVALLARRGSPLATKLLGALLMAGALAAAAITWSHTTRRGLAATELLEAVAALAVGPLLLGSVRSHLDLAWRPRRRDLLHFLPAAALAAWGLGALVARPALVRPLPLEAILAWQAFYTLISARLVLHARPFSPAAAGSRRLAALLVASMLVVHLASAIRFTIHDPRLRDVVPAAIALWIATLTFLAARAWISAPGPDRPRLDASHAAAVVERLKACLEGQRLFLDPDLTVAHLAARADVAPREASAALRAGGSNFADFVNLRRVEEAKRLLGSPEHRHLTVDAIGNRAGFRSRSVFYAAFRRHAGGSPAEYRTSGLRIPDGGGRERA